MATFILNAGGGPTNSIPSGAGSHANEAGATGLVRITEPGATTWRVPTGLTEVYVECWGGGGGGGKGTAADTGGGGGGGGGYAASAVAVTPHDEIDVVVGEGGPPGAAWDAEADPGTYTAWGADEVVGWYGAGAGVEGAAGAGPAAEDSTGDVTYGGGSGAAQSASIGGGGGAAAGREAAGEDAALGVGGVGVAPAGSGGAGGVTTTPGHAGYGYGGGGGGGAKNATGAAGGAGADGAVVIRWPVPE